MNKKYFLSELKSRKWLSIFFILSLIVVYVITYIDATQVTKSYEVFHFDRFITFTSIIYAPFLFFGAISQFSFFHSKDKVDFYHALPISRSKLLITNYLVMPTLLTLPFVVFNLISLVQSILMLESNSVYIYEGYLEYNLFKLISIVISSLLFYSITVFLGTLCGKSLTQAILSLLTFVSPFVFITFTQVIASNTINYGINNNAFLEKIYYFFLPELNFTDTVDLQNYFNLFIQILLISALIYLSCYSYKKFRSEQAGNLFASKFINNLFLIIAPLMTSIFLGLMFSTTFNTYKYETLILSSLFFVTGAIAYFAIIILQSHNKTKKDFQFKTLGILAVISLCYCAILFGDILGLAYKKPAFDEISKIYINNNLVAKNDYDKIIEFQQAVYEEGENASIYPYSQNGEDSYTNSVTNSINFTYALNDGTVFKRQYFLPNNTDLIKYMEDIFTTGNYKEEYIAYLLAGKENFEEYTHINIAGTEFQVSNTDKLIDALVEDIRADEIFGLYNYQPLNFISIYFNDREKYKNNIYYNTMLNINPRYTNTLGVLNTYYRAQFGSDREIVTSTSLLVFDDYSFTDDLKSVKKYNYPYIFVSNNYTNEIKDMDNTTPYKIYSYKENMAEYYNFIHKELFYNTINQEVIPVTDGRKVYRTTNALYIK